MFHIRQSLMILKGWAKVFSKSLHKSNMCGSWTVFYFRSMIPKLTETIVGTVLFLFVPFCSHTLPPAP